MSDIKTRVRDIKLHGKIPQVYHFARSYPMLLLDGTLSRLKALPFFQQFNFSTNKGLIIQQSAIPFCGVYLLQEMMAPDGEANAGEPRFRTSARIGISVIIQNNDTSAAEYKLDDAMQAISIGLFSDSTYYNNKSFKIQGFTSGHRQHVFGRLGSLDNETPIAELRFDFVVDLGIIYYPPNIPDMLEVIHLETRYPPPPEDASQVVQAVQEFDVDHKGDF